MLSFVSTGLVYKAYSLGLVYFTEEILSVSFQKFCSNNGSDPMGLGALHSTTGSSVLLGPNLIV